MGNYKRKVTYFYQYNNGVVGATAGFMKMEIRGENVKITINIQEPYRNENGNPVLYFYHEAGEYLSAVKICDVERQGGVLTLQTRTPWHAMFDTGRDLYTFDGVLVLYSDNDYYLGDFDDRDRSLYEVRTEPERDKKTEPEDKRTSAETEDDAALKVDDEVRTEIKSDNESDDDTDSLTENASAAEEKETDKKQEFFEKAGLISGTEAGKNNGGIFEKCKDCPYSAGDKKDDNIKKDNNPAGSADSFDVMLQEYPKLPMYNVDELFDCVRINPKDIGRLDIGNWKLGSNSFLTHGYYTYQYLMLGKMRFDDGKKHAVLGVPGVYTNREKYIANMFGFDTFIPIKKSGVRNGVNTGQFGYWIVELCR